MKTKIGIFTPEFWEWIYAHSKASIGTLALEARKVMDADTASLALTQVEGRRKAASKIGQFIEQCPRFIFPSALVVEQCSSLPVARFNAQVAGLKQASRMADLTFGLGIDAFAAAMAGAQVQGVDIDRTAADVGQHNADSLGLNVKVQCSDAIKWLEEAARRGEHFDVLFADPARRRDGGERAYAFADCQPDLGRILDIAPSLTQRLLVKASPMLDVDAVMNELPQVSTLWCVGLRGECKELLLQCDFDSSQRRICVAELDGIDDSIILESPWPRPELIAANVEVSLEGKWLCLPSAALAKARIGDTIMAQWSHFRPLIPQRSIYTTDTYTEGFPGRCLYIKNVYKSLRQAQRLLKGETANVACFDYDLSAEALRARLKLRPLSDAGRFVVGMQVAGEHLLLDCVNAQG